MHSFGIAIVVAVLLAIGFAVVLNAIRRPRRKEFSTEAPLSLSSLAAFPASQFRNC